MRALFHTSLRSPLTAAVTGALLFAAAATLAATLAQPPRAVSIVAKRPTSRTPAHVAYATFAMG